MTLQTDLEKIYQRHEKELAVEKYDLGKRLMGCGNMIDDGALENYADGRLNLEVVEAVKPETSYTIEVLKTDPDYIGQQRWMKLLRDGKEIAFNEVPEHHEKPINDLCQILYESKDKISELKIKLK